MLALAVFTVAVVTSKPPAPATTGGSPPGRENSNRRHRPH
jgi:hypothetical protein